jgi:circadian clock protein KaiC
MLKMQSGIPGLDFLSGGGVPVGRLTLLAGGPGCGKTICALQMAAAAAATGGAVFVSFEEDRESLIATSSGFDWQFHKLIDDGKVVFINPVVPVDALQTGPFDLAGLLALIDSTIRRIGARLVVFDGIDVLLSQLNDELLERRELHRIRNWAIGAGITTIVTAKTDADQISNSQKYSFLQFLADCVIFLRHNLIAGVAVRSLRIVKVRATAHSSNEYPLLIGGSGVSVVGAGSKNLSHPVFKERVSSGLDRLDRMLGGGYYKGSSILISGLPGSAKTTLAGLLAAEAAKRGERAVFISFDEASGQICRNLKSVAIDLYRPVEAGLLVMASYRAGTAGSEEYFRDIHDLVERHDPAVLIIDPISNFAKGGGTVHGVGVAERLVDFAKSKGITALFTSLITESFAEAEATVAQISTLADTWMQLSFRVRGGERNRALSIMKSRGMHHSNQVRELILSDEGVTLADVYSAGGDVLMGTARAEREAADAAEEMAQREEFDRLISELELEEQSLVVKAREIEEQIGGRRERLAVMRDMESARIAQKGEREDSIKRLRQADGLESGADDHG